MKFYELDSRTFRTQKELYVAAIAVAKEATDSGNAIHVETYRDHVLIVRPTFVVGGSTFWTYQIITPEHLETDQVVFNCASVQGGRETHVEEARKHVDSMIAQS